jgi:hypothetical protein
MSIKAYASGSSRNVSAVKVYTGSGTKVWEPVSTAYIYTDLYGWKVVFPNQPTAPSNVVATAIYDSVNKSRIRLQWTAPTNNGGGTISNYRIEESLDGVNWSFKVLNDNTTLRNISNITPGTGYYYRVMAVTEYGIGLPSPSSNRVVPFTTPKAPSNVWSYSSTDGPTIAWVGDFSDEAWGWGTWLTYQVQRNTSSTAILTQTNWVTFNQFEAEYGHTFTEVPVGTLYYMRARAINVETYTDDGVNNDGEPSIIVSASKITASVIPTAPIVTVSLSGSTVTINAYCNNNGGESVYQWLVYYKKTTDANYTVLGTYNDSGYEYLDITHNLPSSGVYNYAVAARNIVGYSDFGYSSNVAYNVGTVPPVPSASLAVSNYNDLEVSYSVSSNGGTPLIEWGIYQYLIAGSTTISEGYISQSPVAASGNSGSLVTTTLAAPGFTYRYAITAKNSVGFSDFGFTGFQTIQGYPSVVKNLVGSQNNGIISLSWTTPDYTAWGIGGYKLQIVKSSTPVVSWISRSGTSTSWTANDSRSSGVWYCRVRAYDVAGNENINEYAEVIVNIP